MKTKTFLYTIKLFLLCYIAFLAFMYILQRKLLYLPSKVRPDLGVWKGIWKEVQIETKDKLQLLHWYSKKGPTYILIFHGNAGNIEDRAYKFQFLVDEGYSVLLVSYRGYGDNPGKPKELDMISDSTLALEWLLAKEKIATKDIVLLGESLGSGVAIALAAQYPVKGLIFDGAYSSITEVAQSVYPYIPVSWLLKDKWDSESRIQKVHSPSFFIHSKKDSVLPFRLAKKLFQAAKEPKQHLWLEQSNHNDNLNSDSVKKSILDFLQSL